MGLVDILNKKNVTRPLTHCDLNVLTWLFIILHSAFDKLMYLIYTFINILVWIAGFQYDEIHVQSPHTDFQ